MSLRIDSQNPTFQHKIIMDIGASNPKGTLKITVLSDLGKTILRVNSPNSYVNNTVDGFESAKDFIEKIGKIIRRTYERVLLKDQSGEFPLSEKDKKLSGIVMFVPGTTLVKRKAKSIIAFMPNLRDRFNESLKDIDFSNYIEGLKTSPKSVSGIDVDKNFDMVVTKDLGGAGVGLARLMAKKKMLKESDYVMAIMTGGGFGSVNIKVKNGIVNFETSESSSYVVGNNDVYDTVAKLLEEVAKSKNPQQKLEELKAGSELKTKLKEIMPVSGKLGRQGVNVKSHLETFCSEIGRPDLYPLLCSIGDARIVEMNRMCVSEKDTEIINKLRNMPNEFREIESTTDGKIAFEMREEFFGKEKLIKARTTAINDYANTISLISINKINDCLNKVVLLGPFAHGVNQYVKTHSDDFGGATDLTDLVVKKVKANIEQIDLPSTRELMKQKLYNFQVICDNELNFADNTFAGDLFLNPKFEFAEDRGSWFSIPLKTLKKS